MKYNISSRLCGAFYTHICKSQLKRELTDHKAAKAIKSEYRNIILRAKDIGNSKLLSSYFMAAWFIALNRSTDLSPEDNYRLFEEGIRSSRLFSKIIGNADSYLDERKMPGRKEWEKKSHERKYENDWVVDILDKTNEYELGYDYHECGICKLCRDEGCFELAQYLCRLDFVLADIMGMKLKRTMTLAQGNEKCDFRYSRTL